MKNMNWVNNFLGYLDIIRWGYVGCCRLGIDCRLRLITITRPVARSALYLLQFSYLDCEYETLPIANHYTNDNQCISQTNSVIHYVNSPCLGHT